MTRCRSKFDTTENRLKALGIFVFLVAVLIKPRMMIFPGVALYILLGVVQGRVADYGGEQPQNQKGQISCRRRVRKLFVISRLKDGVLDPQGVTIRNAWHSLALMMLWKCVPAKCSN